LCPAVIVVKSRAYRYLGFVICARFARRYLHFSYLGDIYAMTVTPRRCHVLVPCTICMQCRRAIPKPADVRCSATTSGYILSTFCHYMNTFSHPTRPAGQFIWFACLSPFPHLSHVGIVGTIKVAYDDSQDPAVDQK